MRAVVVVAAIATVVLAAGIGVALATGDDDRKYRRAVAVLENASGDRVGVAFFKERRWGVEVSAAVWDQTPGFHGFHAHAVGRCVPPFTSAGGHYNPTGAPHGEHAGDFPSLLVTREGSGRLQFVTDRFRIGDLFDADGSAVIVHAGRDNFANIPNRYRSPASPPQGGPDRETLESGDSGARVACGVVERRWYR
ncbi:MAG: superoxide dismutase family protein [Thermoleophilaceae bacterium]|nr:superoxide dismutase family protein [Thermoleophilaceae bacterium]